MTRKLFGKVLLTACIIGVFYRRGYRFLIQAPFWKRKRTRGCPWQEIINTSFKRIDKLEYTKVNKIARACRTMKSKWIWKSLKWTINQTIKTYLRWETDLKLFWDGWWGLLDTRLSVLFQVLGMSLNSHITGGNRCFMGTDQEISHHLGIFSPWMNYELLFAAPSNH